MNSEQLKRFVALEERRKELEGEIDRIKAEAAELESALPCYSLITKIGLEKTKNAQGIVYSRATFTSGGRLSPEQAARIKDYAAMLKPFLESAPSAPTAKDVQHGEGEII